MNFMHEDTGVTRLLGTLMDLVLLNVFWFLCCLPIVTIGASTTALYDMTMKLARHEETGVISGFFKSFVHHLKRGTGLFLIALAAGVFLALDLISFLLFFLHQVLFWNTMFLWLCADCMAELHASYPAL